MPAIGIYSVSDEEISERRKAARGARHERMAEEVRVTERQRWIRRISVWLAIVFVIFLAAACYGRLGF